MGVPPPPPPPPPVPHILEKLLMEAPQQVVNFKVYKRDQEEGVAGMDRRLTRIKNQNYLPLGVWAKWVVESIPGHMTDHVISFVLYLH